MKSQWVTSTENLSQKWDVANGCEVHLFLQIVKDKNVVFLEAIL